MVENKPDAVETALEKATPFISNITFGGVMGYCSGFALKKVGKALAVVVGLGFVAVQGAVYQGYLNVDWAKIKDDGFKKIDTDADGKLTSKDAKEYWRRFKDIMKTRLPGASGFSMGFAFGVKHG